MYICLWFSLFHSFIIVYMNNKHSDRLIPQLTRAEEEVMQKLWEIGQGVVHDLLAKFPEPRPAYNTVSTIIRILEQKGFVGHRSYGRTHQYYPLITKDDYARTTIRGMLANYFGNSYKSLVSFFARDENLTIGELEEIRKAIKKEIKKQKGERS